MWRLRKSSQIWILDTFKSLDKHKETFTFEFRDILRVFRARQVSGPVLHAVVRPVGREEQLRPGVVAAVPLHRRRAWDLGSTPRSPKRQ